MPRRALIAAVGSIALHAGLFLLLALVEPPRAQPAIGRPADGAIAVELLAAGGGAPGEAPAGGSTPGPSEGGGRRSLERSARPTAAAAVRPPGVGDVHAAAAERSSRDPAPIVGVTFEPPGTAVGRGAVISGGDGVAGQDGVRENADSGAGAGQGTNGGDGADEGHGAGAGHDSGAGNGAGVGPGAGAGPGSSAGHGAGTGTGGGPGAADWAKLEAHLRTHASRCYPPAARRRSIQGGAQLHFCIGDDGMPGPIRLEKSSGSSLLDRAAIECVLHGAAPLPGPRGCVTVPVWFRL